MDLDRFVAPETGDLVRITGSDPVTGPWEHRAFVPVPLPDTVPQLSVATWLQITRASEALARLDATATRLPNPRLLRAPVLRSEAQSTSALEGTHATLDEVLATDEDRPETEALTEILNYVTMAEHGYGWVEAGRPVTRTLLEQLQGSLMRGTRQEPVSGRLRDHQVVIGRRDDAPAGANQAEASRFVPCPPGDQLDAGVQALVTWLQQEHPQIPPVAQAAMAHYQFETLHPFAGGNGRLGRFLIVLSLVQTGLLREPTISVSGWFEARRREYYDRLLAVSCETAWDAYLGFFAEGLRASATATLQQMRALVDVQAELHDLLRASPLRAKTAPTVVDFALANPSFTVRAAEAGTGLTYQQVNRVVAQLLDLGVLAEVNATRSRNRRYFAPRVWEVLRAD